MNLSSHADRTEKLVGIRKVTFNGKSGGRDVARSWILAMNDPGIITEKAGFLFKAAVRNEHLLLAAAPVLINGQRSYHYNQQLDKEDAFTLIGDINAAGVFTILFKPETLQLTMEQKEHYIRNFRLFAAWLLDAGYSGEGVLGEVTQSVLGELGLSPAPRTLAELQIFG